MTGPEHFRRAEAILDSVRQRHLTDKDDDGRTVESYDDGGEISAMIAAAQVHATLAVAAAATQGTSQYTFALPGGIS